MIENGDVVCYKKGNGFRDVVLEDVLKMYSQRGNVKLSSGKVGNRVALSNTADFETYSLIDELFNKTVREHRPVEGKIIKPLYLFLDKEVLLYAKLKGLKFKEEKKQGTELNKFIDSLEEKHPELKQAVVRGIIGLK